MTRREALAALVAMPEIARISAAPVAPTDVIVVESGDHLSDTQMKRMRAYLSEIWPGRKIIVLDRGLSLKVMAGS